MQSKQHGATKGQRGGQLTISWTCEWKHATWSKSAAEQTLRPDALAQDAMLVSVCALADVAINKALQKADRTMRAAGTLPNSSLTASCHTHLIGVQPDLHEQSRRQHACWVLSVVASWVWGNIRTSHTLRCPQFSTEAASRFCILRDTILAVARLSCGLRPAKGRRWPLRRQCGLPQNRVLSRKHMDGRGSRPRQRPIAPGPPLYFSTCTTFLYTCLMHAVGTRCSPS